MLLKPVNCKILSEISLKVSEFLEDTRHSLDALAEPREGLEFCKNIEGLAARFYVDFEGAFGELYFSLAGSYDFVYAENLDEDDEDFEYGDQLVNLPVKTEEGRARTERDSIKFVLSCVRQLDPSLPYIAWCLNEQKSFYSIAKRLGFICVDEHVLRLPDGTGGFLRVRPQVERFFLSRRLLKLQFLKVVQIAYQIPFLKKIVLF